MIKMSVMNMWTSGIGAASLKGLATWLGPEVQIAVGVVALVVGIFFISKQQIGRVISTILTAAFFYFMANDPGKILKSVGDLFSHIFGG